MRLIISKYGMNQDIYDTKIDIHAHVLTTTLVLKCDLWRWLDKHNIEYNKDIKKHY